MAILKFDKRLKSILHKRALVSEEVLSDALTKAEEEEQSLTQVLLGDSLVEEEDLLTALSEETGLPPVNVFKLRSDEPLATLLPRTWQAITA